MATSDPPRRDALRGDPAAAAGPATPAPAQVPRHVLRFVAALVLLVVVGIVALALLLPTPWPGWGPLAVVTAVVVLSHVDSALIHFIRRELRIVFSFSEIGALLALVLLPGWYAVLAVLVGSVVYEVLTRRAPVKAAFNVAQHGLGASVAVLVLAVTPPLGAVAFGVSLVSASLAVLGYVLMTLAMWLALLVLLAGDGAWRELAPSVGIDALASVGTTSVGVIALYLWSLNPALVIYLVAPLLAIVAAYRYLRVAQQLTEQRSADADGLRRLVSSTSDGIVMVEDDGRVQVWNPVMVALTGVEAAVAEGRSLTEVMQGVPRAAPAPLGAEGETLATWGDGRVVEERSSRVHGREHGDAGRVIVLRDVTRQQEVDALKSDFVARVSHELRTPLTPLIGFVELLRSRGDRFEPAAQATALDSMNRNARRLSALVDELLLVVELDEGLQQRAVAVELAPVVAAAVGRLRLDATQHTIELGVPDETLAAGDPERLTEALAHLLDNAVRYSAPGSRVEVTAAAEDEVAVIRVRDQGPGIPPAAHEEIFERFSRLEGPLQMRTGGLGLGLFIARRLAESMGGTLRVGVSTPQGTTMEFRLPTVVPTDPRSGSGPDMEARRDGEGDQTDHGQAATGRRQGAA